METKKEEVICIPSSVPVSASEDAPEQMSMVFRKYFGKKQGVDIELVRRPHEPIDID